MLLPLVLPQLADKVLLFDADNVLPGDDDQPEVAVRHVHLDRLGVRAGLLGCLGELLSRGLAVFIGVCQDDIAVLTEEDMSLVWLPNVLVRERRGVAGGGVGLFFTHRISALEISPEHPLVGRMYPKLPIE